MWKLHLGFKTAFNRNICAHSKFIANVVRHLEDKRCKLNKKKINNLKQISTRVEFITFDNLIKPASICLGYLYLFPPWRMSDIFLNWSNLFENLVIFCQLRSDDLYFEPACQMMISPFAGLNWPDVFIMMTSNIAIV